MGKKYDDYRGSVTAENMAKNRASKDPSPQNEAEAQRAEKVADRKFEQWLEDTEG